MSAAQLSMLLRPADKTSGASEQDGAASQEKQRDMNVDARFEAGAQLNLIAANLNSSV